MSNRINRGTLLNIPLLEERYGFSFLASVGIHTAVAFLIVFGSYLLPRTAVQLGSGSGGGSGSNPYTVGIADELAGGVGMTKPSLVPKPPPLIAVKREREESKAIPLPRTIDSEKQSRRLLEKASREAKKPVPVSKSNVIPAAPEPGAGGTGGITVGSSGGRGGGSGISIGFGSGGLGDSWYARAVEARISSNWIRPPEGVRVEMIYSFYVAADGSIYDVKQLKSSGNPDMDMTAERAIRTSNPLAPPPPEFRGRPIQFMAQFIYPPNP